MVDDSQGRYEIYMYRTLRSTHYNGTCLVYRARTLGPAPSSHYGGISSSSRWGGKMNLQLCNSPGARWCTSRRESGPEGVLRGYFSGVVAAELGEVAVICDSPIGVVRANGGLLRNREGADRVGGSETSDKSRGEVNHCDQRWLGVSGVSTWLYTAVQFLTRPANGRSAPD